MHELDLLRLNTRAITIVWNCVVRRSKNGYGLWYGCRYQDDPKGSIPKFIVNWAATKGFAGAMDDTVKAAHTAAAAMERASEGKLYGTSS